MADLLNAQAQTVLGQVNEVYQKKDFINSPTEPVGPGETVIGVLNDYEKSISSVLHSFVNKIEKIKENQEENEFNEHQLIIIQESFDVLRSLFWTSLKIRLGEKATEQDALSIRENWQVVSFDEVGGLSFEICFIRC